MKTTTILNCLLLLLPFNAVAHPGHDTGPANGQPWGLLALLTLCVLFALVGIYRIRKTASADD